MTARCGPNGACGRTASLRQALHPRAKSFLGLVASRSDDAGKPAWGAQARIGVALGRSERSVRRYVAEAEELGYLKVYRAKPERGPQGRWHRKKTNVYYLCLPKAGDDRPAPRRRQPRLVLRGQQPQRGPPGAGPPAGQAEWRGQTAKVPTGPVPS